MRDDGALYVLVHSPLVGPGTWLPVARELERCGRTAVVPSLTGVADAPVPRWRYVRDAVAESVAGELGSAGPDAEQVPVVLAGHSGAGALLPTIARECRLPLAAMLFVDAFPPPAAGAVELMPSDLLAELRAIAIDGILPPWSQWFDPDELARIVPDDPVRIALEREMPRLPVAYFEERPPVPPGWDSGPCGYLLLADDPYAVAAAEANERGWPVARLPGGHHLSAVTDPTAVAALMLDLERAVDDAG